MRDEVPTPVRLRTLCFWKGIARYYDVTVGGKTERHAAWAYPQPYPWVRRIKGHVAFSHGVQVRE